MCLTMLRGNFRLHFLNFNWNLGLEWLNKAKYANIFFRPGPIQDPGSGFWQGHRVARVNSFFFKSKRRRFSKKTKINGLQPSFWPGLARSTGSPGQQGHTEFFLSLFFLQPGPVPVSSQLNSRSIYQTRPYLKTMHAKILGRKSLHKFEITLIFLPYWSAEDKIKIKIEEEYFKIHLLSLKKTWRKENFEALQITHLNKTGIDEIRIEPSTLKTAR